MIMTMSCSRLPPFYRPEHMIPHTSFCPSRISISLLKKSSLHTSLVCLYEKEEQEFRVFGLAWRCSFLVMQYGPICTPALQPQLPPWFHEQRLIEMIQLIAVFSEELSLATANTKVFDCLEAMVDIKDPSESILAQNALLHALNYTALAIALDQLVPIEQWTINPMASSKHAQLSYNPSEVEVQRRQIRLFSSSFQLDGSCESKDYLHLLCYRLVFHLKFIVEEMGIKSLLDQHKPSIHKRLPASSEKKGPVEVRCSTHR